MDILKFERPLFGDKLIIEVYDVKEEFINPIIDDAYLEALRLQKIFNLYDPNSELSQLNNKKKLKVSPELLHVLKNALYFCKLSNGQFDITLGKLFLARKRGEKEVIPSCSYTDIKIEGNLVTLNHPEIIIDLGSIAKGYLVDKVVEFLEKEGIEEGLVNGRGDIRVFGSYYHDIDILHPRDKAKVLETIRINNESIATSGDYMQFSKDMSKSHIINNQLSSVTVISKDLETSDVLATLISILNENFIKIIKTGHIFKAITVDKGLNIKYYET